jgi:glycerophosphoryl diester phosphodiesterase
LRPILDRCVLISFDLPSVQILRAMTGVRIGWVLEHFDQPTLEAAATLGPEYLFCNLERIPSDSGALPAGPWDWAIYEVRDLKTAQHCRSLGAAYVETMTVRGLLSAYDDARRHW